MLDPQCRMSDTVPIIYNGGAYGTYVEWCLSVLAGHSPLTSPFTSDGTSHQYIGHQVPSIQGWRDYLNAGVPSQFVRFHPKTQAQESLISNLDEVADSVESFVYLYPDHDSVLLHLNNFFFKSYAWWPHNLYLLDRQRIVTQWSLPEDITWEQIPPWVKREFLSYYLMPAWHDQLEWYLPDRYHNPKCVWIYLSDLLFDFESTLEKIVAHIGLTVQLPVKDLTPFHQTNLSLQQFVGQDQLCHRIVSTAIAGESYDWSGLSLPSEAWVQWQLRNLGYEVRCHGLDIFPSNSVQLTKLLYKL